MQRDSTYHAGRLAGNPADHPDATTVERSPDQTPTESVVSGVAELTGEDPTSLPPLYDVVDPDMLDRLFAMQPNGVERATRGVVEFDYAGCTVFVYATDRTVVVPTSSF